MKAPPVLLIDGKPAKILKAKQATYPAVYETPIDPATGEAVGKPLLLAEAVTLTTQTFTILNKANHHGTERSLTATIPAGVQIMSVRYYVDSTNNQGVIQYTNPATQ